MISTQNSQQFTAPSAASLIKKTRLRPDDKFIIVDNDGTLGEIPGACVIRNERRRKQLFFCGFEGFTDFRAVSNSPEPLPIVSRSAG